MKWYTCIIRVPGHINDVQYFHTRAEDCKIAEAHALNWIFDGDPNYAKPSQRDKVDVPLIFEGRLDPVNA